MADSDRPETSPQASRFRSIEPGITKAADRAEHAEQLVQIASQWFLPPPSTDQSTRAEPPAGTGPQSECESTSDSAAICIESAPRPGFSGVQVWRVRRGANAYALRRWLADVMPVVRLAGIHRLLAELRQKHQLSFVAAPLPLSDISFNFPSSASVKTKLTAAGHRTWLNCDGAWWQLEPWLPGEPVTPQTITAAQLIEAAQSLAHWHRAAAQFQSQGDESTWFFQRPSGVAPAVTERFRRARDWIFDSDRLAGSLKRLDQRIDASPLAAWRSRLADLSQRCREWRPRVCEHLAVSESLMVPVQPCLRDVWRDHLLFTGEHVTGVIDPWACRSDTVAADLSRWLGSAVGNDWSAWSAAIEAYSTIRPLSLAERQLIAVLDLSGVLLSAAYWLERIANAEPNAAAALLTERLAARLDELRARWDGAAAGRLGFVSIGS